MKSCCYTAPLSERTLSSSAKAPASPSITTAGFEDAIEIGRQARPKLYDFFFDRVEPLVPAELRFGVNERTDAGRPNPAAPNAAGTGSLPLKSQEMHPKAIAISCCFPSRTQRTSKPSHGRSQSLGVPISVSHQILPEFREYERTSTVVVNAYLQPVMQRYLENLDGRLDNRSALKEVERLCHAIQRWHHCVGHRSARTGAHGPVGTGGRRGGRRGHRPPQRAGRGSSPSTWAAPPPTSRS